MINHRYLLESGAPDGYRLEDDSGVLILEESNPVTPDMIVLPTNPTLRGKQRGFMEFSQSLLLTTLAVAAAVILPREAWHQHAVQKKEVVQDELGQNRLPLTAVVAAAPFIVEDFHFYDPKYEAQGFIDGRVIVADSTRDSVQQPPVRRTRSQQVEQYPNTLPLTSVVAAPFEPLSFDQPERRLYQQVEQPVNALLIQWPFLPPDSGWSEREREYQQIEQQPNPFAYNAILSAPFVLEQWPEFQKKRDQWPLFETSEFPAPFEILAAPFTPEENGYTYRKNEYQQVEQQPNPFAFRNLLEAPFIPKEFPQTGQAKRDAQDYTQSSLDLTAMPFPSWDVGYSERKDEYQQVEQQPNQFAFYGNLEAPFVLEQWPEFQKKRDQWPLFETSEFPAPFQILEEPFVPVEFPLTGTARRDAQDWVQQSIAITAMPFASADLGYYAAKEEYQQVEQQPNPFAFRNALSAPFIPVDYPQTGQARRDAQDYYQASLDLFAMPFASGEWPLPSLKKRDQWPLFETSEFPAPFQILEEPFVPVDFPQTGQAKRDAQDYTQSSLDLTAMPFPSWDVGFYAAKEEYQQVEQQPNPFAYGGTLERPFTPVTWPEFQRKRNYEPLFETSEFPAPFQVLEEPFIPVDFPQTGQAKRDAQDYTQSSLDLTAMPFPSWDVGFYAAKEEYQQVEQQPNYFAFTDQLEAPFIPEAFENPYAKKPDAQDFIAFYFDTASAFAPFTPVTWPEFQKKRDQWPLFETSEFPAPFQILEEPFVPVEFPQTGQARRDAQDWTQQSIAITAMPFASGDWPLAAQKKRDQWPLFETSEFPAPFQILEEPFVPVMWPEFERVPSYQDEQQPNPLSYRGVLAAPFIPVDFPQTGQARRDAQDWQLASIAITAMPFPSADLGYYAAKLVYQQIAPDQNYFAFSNALEAPFIPEAFPNPEPRKQDEPDHIVFYFDVTNAFNPFVPVDFPQTGQAKRDAQDHVWFYFDAANAFAPFTPVTWPEFEQKFDYQDYQQRSLDLVAMPFPSWDVGYFERKDEYQQIEPEQNRFAVYGILEAPFIPEAFENPYAKKPDAQDYQQRSLDLVAMPFASADLGYYAIKAEYRQIDPEQNKFAVYGNLEAPFIPEAFPNPEPRKQDAQDFILFYFDRANAFAPFIPVDFPQTGQARRDAQDHVWFYFDAANAFAPFVPAETAQDVRRLHTAPVEIYLNVSALYAAAGVPFTPAIFETPQVQYEYQDFVGGSLNLTAKPFVPADAAQQPYARPQQQVEQWQNVYPLYIGDPFIPTENGWYEAKVKQHHIDEPQNLYPLHDLPVYDPFVPYEWPQTKQTKQDFEQQQYPNFSALLLSRHPGKPFCVHVHNRNYIVEPQPRVYCVEYVDRIYIVVENARIYYAEPVVRVYEPED